MKQCLKSFIAVVCFLAVGTAFATDELNSKVKFNFLRGKAAFQRNDYQTAVTELQTYLKTDPQNHHALNLLGQAHHKQKNLKEAVKNYEMAIKYAPTTVFAGLYHFNAGVALFDMKNYNAAIPHLSVAGKDIPRLPSAFREKKALAHYYKAFSYYSMQQWKPAAASFEESAQHTLVLNQGAWFYKAMAELKMGNIQTAKEHLVLAQKINTSSALTRYSTQLLDKIGAHRAQKKWNFLVGMQGWYDDNILLEPDSGTSPISNISDEKGTKATLVFEPSYNNFFKNNWAFEGKGHAAYGMHMESKHAPFDYLSSGLNFIFTKHNEKIKGQSFGFDTGVAYNLSGRKTISKTNFAISEDANFLKPWKTWFHTDFQGHAEFADFPEPSTASTTTQVGTLDRDNWNVNGALANYLYAFDKKLKTTLAFGLGKTWAEGDLFDKWGWQANVGVNYSFLKDWKIDGTVNVDDEDYYNRVDIRTYTYRVGLFKNWSNAASSSLSYSSIDSDSATAANEYKRQLIMLSYFYLF